MTACMRWQPGRVQSWRRPADGGFNPARYGVQAITDPAAKAFVTGLHYSGTYPAATQRYGLFDLTGQAARLLGAAVLSVPASKTVLTAVFPRLEPYSESIELGRFVLRDEVPANGESWFLAEVRRLAARQGIRGIVSFSDPVARTTTAGQVVMPGHVGVIYQASNAVYTGRATARTLVLLPDGQVFSARAAQKIRARDRGHEYAERQLVALGASAPRAGERPGDWLAAALDDVGARRIRHPGNHRYAFTVGARADRARVMVAPRPRAYPKASLGQLAMFTPTDQAGRDSGVILRAGGSDLRATPQPGTRLRAPRAAQLPACSEGRPSRPACTTPGGSR